MWRWRVRYDGYNGNNDGGFFSLHRAMDEDDVSRRQSQLQVLPWSDQFKPALNSIYIPNEDPEDDEFVVVDEVKGYDPHSWVKVEDSSLNSTSKTIALPGTFPKFYPNFWQHLASFQNENSVKVRANARGFDSNISEATPKPLEGPDIYGNHRPMFMAIFVRLLLIAHNVMTVWRVTEAYDNNMYWLMVLSNFFLIFEGQIVVVKRHGMDYSWWCPCFLFYLAATIPGIWLLQINQYDRFVESQKLPPTSAPLLMTSNMMSSVVTNTILCTNMTSNNMTSSTPSTTTTTTVESAGAEAVIGTLDNDVWVIIIEESLVYLLVLSRWLLPRGNVSRDFLSDLLLEFLAIASDIMELLAVFDEDRVRGNLGLTYAVLAVWSASFIQFVPILMQKRRFRRVRNMPIKGVARVCGEHFVEIVVTCLSIFLQDLPFLVVRLYIMIAIQLVTYSLIFFVLKNIVTLMLLFYRLTILCYRIPCCSRPQPNINKVKNPDGLY
ncbi:hypothetical protein ACF0H5_000524 [Mactra antiquata]